MNRPATSARSMAGRLLALALLTVGPSASTSAQSLTPPLLSTAATRPSPENDSYDGAATGASAGDSTMTVVTGIVAEAAPADSSPPSQEGTSLHAESHENDSLEVLDGGDYPRLEQSEYLWAGRPRYTLTGKLPYRETHVQSGTMMAFGGALLGLAATITWYQQAWYPDSTKGPFNFQVDWGYSKQYDKAGHMYAGWMSSYCSYEAFIACGLSPEDAAIWGAAGGLFFQTFIEVQDGFHTNYGFDWTDQISNAIGVGYFYAQQRIPFLQNFDPKWSVGPSGRDSAREAAQIRERIIVDDYDRQDVWMSMKVHNLLPEGMRSYWPKWLQLAVGAGARDVELQGYYSYRTLHVALDYDLVELLPDMGSFGNWLVQGLNNFKFPAPALQLWPKVQFKLLYPFSL